MNEPSEPLATPTAASLPQPPLDQTVLTEAEGHSGDDLPPVGKRYIWLMVLAQFGVFMAFITPLAISLTIRVNQLAPGHAEYLGFITAGGALVVMLTAPFMGVWSDRTRTRFGRRRPFMVGGLVLGLVALTVMALAPSVPILGVGWILAQLGWGTTLSNLQISTADRLPEGQRGQVGGLTGFATQVAPVFGVIIAQFFTANMLALFLIPGVIGVLTVLAFVLFVHEDSSVGLTFADKITVGSLLRRYLFRPADYPDFSWNWLGRFFFYAGITLNTTFTAFFFADRLGVTVEAVAGIVAMLGLGGVLATTAGAIGGGFLSDRLKRRKVFVLAGALLMAGGMVLQALSTDIVGLVAGSLLASMGLGLFASVDQALLLDVLPEKATEAGRFMGITGFATSIPQSVAPLVASWVLTIGVIGAQRNYSLLYLVAAAITVVAGLVILKIRAVR